MYFYTLLINQGVRKVLTSALKQEANWHVICTIRCRSSVTSLVLKNMWTYACHLPQYPIPDVYFTSMTDKCTTMKLRNRTQSTDEETSRNNNRKSGDLCWNHTPTWIKVTRVQTSEHRAVMKIHMWPETPSGHNQEWRPNCSEHCWVTNMQVGDN